MEHAEVHNAIRASGWATGEERERVIAKFFAKEKPIISYLRRNHRFGDRRVLDIGAGYGNTLLYWGSSSEGVDVSSQMSGLPSKIGRKIYITNVEEQIVPPETPLFEGVYSNNLIEHLIAPHLFLVRVRDVMADDAILCLGHPTVSPLRRVFGNKLQYRGYASVEHVNFFTPITIRHTLERSGFDVIEQVVPRRYMTLRWPLSVAPVVYSICRKIPGWKYPEKRAGIFDPEYARLEHLH